MSAFVARFRQEFTGLLAVFAVIGAVLALLGFAAASELAGSESLVYRGYGFMGLAIVVVMVLIVALVAFIGLLKSRRLDAIAPPIELPPPITTPTKPPVIPPSPATPARPPVSGYPAPSVPTSEPFPVGPDAP